MLYLATKLMICLLAAMASTSAADEDVGFDISSTDTLSVTKLQPVYLNHRRNRRRRKRNASTPPPNKLPPGPEYTPPIPMPLSSKSSKSGKKSSSSKSLSSKSSFSKSGKKSKSKGKKCKKSDKSDKCDEEPEMFTDAPTTAPTLAPTLAPVVPSPGPTAAPTATSVPTILGTEPPSRTPSATDPPSPVPDEPSASPSKVPTEEPAEDFETTLGLAEVATQYQSAFTNAATRWDSIIVGDEEDVVVTAQDKTDSMCTDSGIPDLIDDIYICAVIEDIDGPGQILGSAGPELAIFGPGSRVRPFIGRMRFDTADVDGLVAAGTFEGVILHEMGHVYGIGTLWNAAGFYGADQCSYNTGNKVTDEWQALSGCTGAIPLEQDGGAGTACGHWDEECFIDEIMTGFNTGGLPISRVTVASLDDLGYTVSYAAADPFPASALGPCRCNNIEVEVPRESGKLDAMTTITQENVGREDDTKDDEVVHEEGPRESVKLDAEDNVGGEEAGQEVAEKKRFRIGGGTTKKIDNNAHGRTRGKTTGRVTGTGRVGGKRRKLSHEGRQVAINYGKSELRKRKAMRASMPPEQKSRYIGDLFISVIYMEEGEVYTVEVWGDDV